MWEDSAPSNIALIKYMGKMSQGKNLAVNPSLSWTLENLRTFIQIEELAGATADRWEPHPQAPRLELSAKGEQKFLKHFAFLKEQFGVKDRYFVLRSGNNFPSDCGIASSASSFAALTRCACTALAQVSQLPPPDTATQAQWSRQGSGSSCRSFFSGWVAWDGESVAPVPSNLKGLWQQVFIVSGAKKNVSSSEAHQVVQTSLLMSDRPARSRRRYDELMAELKSQSPSWRRIYELTWADFWDMHALFETSVPPFGYMQKESFEILQAARHWWEVHSEGPLVTMDAGANVHLLWKHDQRASALEFARRNSQFSVLSNLGDDQHVYE